MIQRLALLRRKHNKLIQAAQFRYRIHPATHSDHMHHRCIKYFLDWWRPITTAEECDVTDC